MYWPGLPKKRQTEVKKALNRIFNAACLDDARDEARSFLPRYGREFPTATQVLASHLEECLTFYRFPERHVNSEDVVDQLFHLFVFRRIPEYLRSDNGPEFTAKVIREWLNRLGERVCGVLQRQAAG